MDRQTAVSLLDNLVGMVEDSQENDYDTALKMGIEALKGDVQLVVRCEDCDSAERSGVMIYCLMHGRYMRDNDFCSYGKREDGEQSGWVYSQTDSN